MCIRDRCQPDQEIIHVRMIAISRRIGRIDLEKRDFEEHQREKGSPMPPANTKAPENADVVLIGGGVMSATLGAMLALLEPDWRIVVLERGEDVAAESTSPWNNAGTGHAGYCELNYMPDPEDPSKAAEVSRQFLLSRQWWSHLASLGFLDPEGFIRSAPHMSIVFGQRDVEYLRRRCEALL